MNKNRGITLLELTITMTVLAMLTSAAAPSFSSMIEKAEMQNLSFELQAVLFGAKSEAVMRNQEVYIHAVNIPVSPTASDDWCIHTSLSPTEKGCTGNSNSIGLVTGNQYEGMAISRHKNYARIKVSPLNGWPDIPTSDAPLDFICFYNNESKPVQVKITFTGKVRNCGVGGDWYGIGECGEKIRF